MSFGFLKDNGDGKVPQPWNFARLKTLRLPTDVPSLKSWMPTWAELYASTFCQLTLISGRIFDLKLLTSQLKDLLPLLYPLPPDLWPLTFPALLQTPQVASGWFSSLQQLRKVSSYKVCSWTKLRYIYIFWSLPPKPLNRAIDHLLPGLSQTRFCPRAGTVRDHWFDCCSAGKSRAQGF